MGKTALLGLLRRPNLVQKLEWWPELILDNVGVRHSKVIAISSCILIVVTESTNEQNGAYSPCAPHDILILTSFESFSQNTQDFLVRGFFDAVRVELKSA